MYTESKGTSACSHPAIEADGPGSNSDYIPVLVYFLFAQASSLVLRLNSSLKPWVSVLYVALYMERIYNVRCVEI